MQPLTIIIYLIIIIKKKKGVLVHSRGGGSRGGGKKGTGGGIGWFFLERGPPTGSRVRALAHQVHRQGAFRRGVQVPPSNPSRRGLWVTTG